MLVAVEISGQQSKVIGALHAQLLSIEIPLIKLHITIEIQECKPTLPQALVGDGDLPHSTPP